MVHTCNNAIWSALENCLVPPAVSTTWYYSTLLKKSLGAVCLLPCGIITGAFVGVQKACSFAGSFLKSPVIVDAKKNFQAVVDDSRLWSQMGTSLQMQEELRNNPSGLQNLPSKALGPRLFKTLPSFVLILNGQTGY